MNPLLLLPLCAALSLSARAAAPVVVPLDVQLIQAGIVPDNLNAQTLITLQQLASDPGSAPRVQALIQEIKPVHDVFVQWRDDADAARKAYAGDPAGGKALFEKMRKFLGPKDSVARVEKQATETAEEEESIAQKIRRYLTCVGNGTCPKL